MFCITNTITSSFPLLNRLQSHINFIVFAKNLRILTGLLLGQLLSRLKCRRSNATSLTHGRSQKIGKVTSIIGKINHSGMRWLWTANHIPFKCLDIISAGYRGDIFRKIARKKTCKTGVQNNHAFLLRTNRLIHLVRENIGRGIRRSRISRCKQAKFIRSSLSHNPPCPE